jgi:DNA-binding transcriptional ArsR family regulator
MPAGESVDYDKLEQYLRALSHSRRLELLHLLRMPHALNDIRLGPGKLRAGTHPERAVARQSIQMHLDKLMDIGAVVAREAEGPGRHGKEFVVNPLRVYQITEEFRKVTIATAGAPVGRDATVESAMSSRGEMAPGPKLVLVHGFLEGRAFPLRRSDLEAGGGWVVGRKAGLPVSLEYDPYVSLVNSEVLLDKGEYFLADLGSSKNGTWLNWKPVGEQRMPLAPGDVVGVGRSLLVFRRE